MSVVEKVDCYNVILCHVIGNNNIDGRLLKCCYMSCQR